MQNITTKNIEQNNIWSVKSINILYINARINSNAYIARKNIALINALIKKVSLSKNVTFVRKLTRHLILNILKNKKIK